MLYIAKYDDIQKVKQHENCIYYYVCTTNGKGYVGQAKNLKRRARQHLKGDVLKIDQKIKQYGPDNFILYVLKENLSNQCLLNMYECYFIKKYNTHIINKQGYNVADGGHNGDTWSGKSLEQKEKMKDAISKANSGKKHSEQTKKKMSEGHKGQIPWNAGKTNVFDEEALEKISTTSKTYWTEDKKQQRSQQYFMQDNPNAKQVAQYDLQGKFIKKWDCVKLANIHYNCNSINEACTGRIKTCCGYQWKYIENEFYENDIEPYVGKITKRVVQYDLQGNFIKIWDSAGVAAKHLNIGQRGIENCCKGSVKKSGGFIWKYEEE